MLATWKALGRKLGIHTSLKYRIRRADGAYRWFHVRSLPWRDTEGRIIRWYTLRTDIDDRQNRRKTGCRLLLDVTNQVVSKLAAQRNSGCNLVWRPARHAMRSGECLLPRLEMKRLQNVRDRFSRQQRIHSRGAYFDRGVAWWFCFPYRKPWLAMLQTLLQSGLKNEPAIAEVSRPAVCPATY